eukprot:gene12540-8592_t
MMLLIDNASQRLANRLILLVANWAGGEKVGVTHNTECRQTAGVRYSNALGQRLTVFCFVFLLLIEFYSNDKELNIWIDTEQQANGWSTGTMLLSSDLLFSSDRYNFFQDTERNPELCARRFGAVPSGSRKGEEEPLIWHFFLYSLRVRVISAASVFRPTGSSHDFSAHKEVHTRRNITLRSFPAHKLVVGRKTFAGKNTEFYVLYLLQTLSSMVRYRFLRSEPDHLPTSAISMHTYFLFVVVDDDDCLFVYLFVFVLFCLIELLSLGDWIESTEARIATYGVVCMSVHVSLHIPFSPNSINKLKAV